MPSLTICKSLMCIFISSVVWPGNLGIKCICSSMKSSSDNFSIGSTRVGIETSSYALENNDFFKICLFCCWGVFKYIIGSTLQCSMASCHKISASDNLVLPVLTLWGELPGSETGYSALWEVTMVISSSWASLLMSVCKY